MDKCQVEHTPAYIESTIEAAPFYLKNGFTAIETFSIDLTPSEPNGVEKYEEQSFVFNTT